MNYRGKLNTIKIYLMSRDDRNALLDGHNDIIVPLAGEVVQSLFGCDIPKKKRNEEEIDDDDNDDDEEENDDDNVCEQSCNDISLLHARL